MQKKKCAVIISSNIRPEPSYQEVTAAMILLEYFKKDVSFVERDNLKTPDFIIDGKFWELKSPQGTGKHNIQNALQNAVKQSENIVFDARQSKIHLTKIKHELAYQMGLIRKINKLLLITKTEEVVEIKRKK